MSKLDTALDDYRVTLCHLLDEEFKAFNQNAKKPNLGSQIELDSEQAQTFSAGNAGQSTRSGMRANTMIPEPLAQLVVAKPVVKNNKRRNKANSKTVNPLNVMGGIIALSTVVYAFFFFFL